MNAPNQTVASAGLASLRARLILVSSVRLRVMVGSPCKYIRTRYGVPAEIGRRVVIDGKPGIIAQDRGTYIGVVLDEDPPNRILPYHPTWLVEYGDMGEVRKMTRSQKRYQDYLEVADCFEGFMDYLNYLTMDNNAS